MKVYATPLLDGIVRTFTPHLRSYSNLLKL